ncbi:MAG: hypothetical protein WD872_01860 [Pirellulaceae bacterium]
MSDTKDAGQKRAATDWSYDDPASVASAIERMANDPEVLREVAAIERDFGPLLNDGLQKYE